MPAGALLLVSEVSPLVALMKDQVSQLNKPAQESGRNRFLYASHVFKQLSCRSAIEGMLPGLRPGMCQVQPRGLRQLKLK